MSKSSHCNHLVYLKERQALSGVIEAHAVKDHGVRKQYLKHKAKSN